MNDFWFKFPLHFIIYVALMLSPLSFAQEDISDRIEKKAKLSDTKKNKKKKKKKNGIFFGNAGLGYRWDKGRSEIRLSGFMQIDTRSFFDRGDDWSNSDLLLRRIQPSLDIKLNSTYSFHIMPSFASAPGILDIFIDGKFSDLINLRIGKFKSPFGLERLQSATALAFNERAFPTNLSPNREIGAQLFGELLNRTTEYQIGLFSGAVDNSSGLRDSVIYSNHSGIDFVSRIFSHPFYHSKHPILNGLGMGIAYSYGTQQGHASGESNLPFFLSPGQQVIAAYTPGAFADGVRQRVSPQLYYHYGPLGIMSEYVISQQTITQGNFSDKVTHDAFQVQISWVLFNGDASFRRIRPNKAIDLETMNSWGAVQLVARYAELHLDANAFKNNLLNPNLSTQSANDFGVGVNWYLNRNIKLQLNYDQTRFTKGAENGVDRSDEKILFSRLQITF